MGSFDEKVQLLDRLAHRIVDDWYERAKEDYVTQEDSQEVRIESEVKRFHRKGNHRIKFSRWRELEVTYGLGALRKESRLCVEASVNNKSEGFDYDLFVDRIQTYYSECRHEKPWTDPEFDHFTFSDLLHFDPRMSYSVSLDIRKDKADIIRLTFALNSFHEERLMGRKELLKDLLENYCFAPLRRIYVESYRKR